MIIWEDLGQTLQTQMPKAGSMNVRNRLDLRQFGEELKNIFKAMGLFLNTG